MSNRIVFIFPDRQESSKSDAGRYYLYWGYEELYQAGHPIGNVITKNSMAAMEAMLPDEAFIRVHRSYIVSNLK